MQSNRQSISTCIVCISKHKRGKETKLVTLEKPAATMILMKFLQQQKQKEEYGSIQSLFDMEE